MKFLKWALLASAFGGLLSGQALARETNHSNKDSVILSRHIPAANQEQNVSKKGKGLGNRTAKPSPYPFHPALMSRGYMNHKRWKRLKRGGS